MEIIINKMHEWYKAQKALNSSGWGILAEKLVLSESYIGKIANRKRNPSYKFAKKFLNEVCEKPSEVSEILREYFPEKYSQDYHEIATDQKHTEKTSWNNPILNDKKLYLLYRLSLSDALSRDELVKIYGESISLKIDFLIENNYIYINEAGKICRNKNKRDTVRNDFDEVLNIFQQNLSLISDANNSIKEEGEDLSKDFKLIGLYESVTQEARDTFINETTSFLNHAYKKLKKDENKGDVPFFINTFIGRFDKLD